MRAINGMKENMHIIRRVIMVTRKNMRKQRRERKCQLLKV
jgi:hypothetical protein